MSKAKKLGVVVFINEDFDERLAALQWASDYSPLSRKDEVVILLVDYKNEGSNKPGEELRTDQLSIAVPGELQTKFDEYKRKFVTKDVSGRPYQGTDIQKMLEGAIKKFNLDTLVLRMADLRKTSNGGSIDLLLDSECSIVLVKIDPKPLMLKTVEIPDEPTEVPTVNQNKTSTVDTSHLVDTAALVPKQDKESSSGPRAEDQKNRKKNRNKNKNKNKNNEQPNN